MQKDQLKEQLTQALAGIAPKDATPQQLHQAIGDVVMHNIAENWSKSTQAHETNRHACYFSMEFLVGRAVFNNLLCLGCYKEVETALQEMGASLASLEEIEDAALGNGGLGRLLPASSTAQLHSVSLLTATVSATNTVFSARR